MSHRAPEWVGKKSGDKPNLNTEILVVEEEKRRKCKRVQIRRGVKKRGKEGRGSYSVVEHKMIMKGSRKERGQGKSAWGWLPANLPDKINKRLSELKDLVDPGEY